MSEVIKNYAQQLRQIVDDHYHQQITRDEYQAQRKIIFDCIESELRGSSGEDLKNGDSE